MTALPKDFRLKKRSDYLNLYKSGANTIKTKYFTFLIKPNKKNNPRLGVVVRKKIIKQAVKRNYVRRVANSLFIIDKQALEKIDIVIILSKNKPLTLDFNDIKHDWSKFLNELHLSK